jgi:hypothetical protein
LCVLSCTPCSNLQLGVDGVFSDFVEGAVFYLRFARANADFPARQVLLFQHLLAAVQDLPSQRLTG